MNIFHPSCEVNLGYLHHRDHGPCVCDQGVQFWLSVLVRKLSRDQAVHLFRSSKLVFMFKEDDHVHVRQTPFLKLNGPKMANSDTKSIVFVYVMQQQSHLGLENPRHQIWPVSCSLPRKQLSLYFWLVWICSHGQEQISTSKMVIKSKCILKILDHGTGAASERRGKNYVPSPFLTLNNWLSWNHFVFKSLLFKLVCTRLIVLEISHS